MKIEFIQKLLEGLRWELSPPGCYSDFLRSQIDDQSLSVEVAVVNEHRFAFYYWSRFYCENIKTTKYTYPIKPILVSLDFHNDVGVDVDCKPEILLELNIENRSELGLFCWSYLNPLNDGHILPSLYLNYFSDVYILNTTEGEGDDRIYLDRYGNTHKISFYHDIFVFIDTLTSINTPVYLDIDLDYFTFYQDNNEFIGSSKLVEDDIIHSTLSLQGKLMSTIFPRLVGLTIALEPQHCGGLNNSMQIFDILNQEFFNKTLLTHSSKWNIK